MTIINKLFKVKFVLISCIARRDREAIIMPVQLHKTDCNKPFFDPPHAKNEAQAVKVIQTGTGKIVAVINTSIPPRMPILNVMAVFLSIKSLIT